MMTNVVHTHLKRFAVMMGMAAVTTMLTAAPVVKQIEIDNQGDGRVDRAFVLAQTTTAVGQKFDRRALARDVKALLQTERFSSVDVALEDVDGGVKLVYRIQNRYRLVDKPDVVGMDRFSRRKIRKWLNLDSGDLVDDREVGKRTRKVIDEYRDRHYPDATCTWSFDVVDSLAASARLTVVVDEGPVNYFRRINVVGNESVTAMELRKALKRSHPLNAYRWIWRKKYDDYDIEEVAEDVRSVYLDHGFLDVEVDVESGSADAKGRREATAHVTEKSRYHIGTIQIDGISVFPTNTVASVVKLRAKDVASVGAIQKTASRLQQYYGDRGYLGASARPLLVPDSATRTVDVTFRIEEGQLISIRNVVIRGNTRTKDKVIRRELLVDPGDTYSQRKVTRSQRRLQNLDFFETVRAFPEETPSPDQRDLVFDVEEKRTGKFMIGAGFSSVDDLMGFVEIQQGNFDLTGWPFIGGGQKLRLRAQFSETREDYTISLVEPWFLDRRISLGMDLYQKDRDYDNYDQLTTGASVTLGKALPWANRLNIKYSIANTEITDVADTNLYYEADTYDFDTDTGDVPFLFRDEEEVLSSSLRFTLIHDTRNSPFVPSAGNRMSLFYELTGGPLGADLDIYEVGLRSAHYVSPWYDHTISLRMRCHFVDTFGDTTEVPLSERLFLGGGRTLRGFEYRDVGPKVLRLDGSDYDVRAQGGQSLFEAKLEYAIPIVPGIRLAAFYDTGNVWREDFKVDLSDLASSYGVGFRLDMPGFPIRIDRAWILEEDDEYTEDELWVFWIGY